MPTGFVPTEDQGYVFVDVQLPDAASKQRTVRVMEELDKICAETKGVANYVSITGYSLLSGSAASNVGFAAVIFEPWEDRKAADLSQEAIVQRLQRAMSGIAEARVFAFVPPTFDGVGNAGVFNIEVK